jgi:hypothetical protein
MRFLHCREIAEQCWARLPRRTADYVDAAYRFCILEGRSHWLPEQARDEIAPLLFDILMHSIRRVTVAGAGVFARK